MKLKDLEKAITVPSEFYPEYANANQCHENLFRICAEVGGELVLGYQIQNDTYYKQLVSHSVWKKPSGELVDISPQAVPTFNDDNSEYIEAILAPIQFLIDPNASARNIYLPKRPRATALCQYLTRSDEALYFDGDYERGVYWTRRAEREMSRLSGMRWSITIPPKDVLGTGQYVESAIALAKLHQTGVQIST